MPGCFIPHKGQVLVVINFYNDNLNHFSCSSVCSGVGWGAGQPDDGHWMSGSSTACGRGLEPGDP